MPEVKRQCGQSTRRLPAASLPRGRRVSLSCSPDKRPEVLQGLVSPSSFRACLSGQHNGRGTGPKPLKNHDRVHLLSEKTQSGNKLLHCSGGLCLVWFSLLRGLVLNTPVGELGRAFWLSSTDLPGPKPLTGRLRREPSRHGPADGRGWLPELYSRSPETPARACGFCFPQW